MTKCAGRHFIAEKHVATSALGLCICYKVLCRQVLLLKSCVAHWLPQMDEVLGFHTAQRQHGSYGATYVLLKKSSKKSLQSREAFLHKKF